MPYADPQAKKDNQKRYRELHKDRLDIYIKKYRQDNKEALAEKDKKRKKLFSNKIKLKLKKNARLREQRRISTDIEYRLRKRLRMRLYFPIKQMGKGGSAIDDLGCSIPKLKIHIESQFKEGMTWENWGRTGWHIDHKIPLSSFNLSVREQFLKACHYSNLQPLWAHENLTKSNKIL